MDLDGYLRRLAAEPVPDLSGIDGVLLAERAESERKQGRVAMTTAAALAMVIGAFGSGLPVAPAEASVVPFGPPSALAPLVQLARE